MIYSIIFLATIFLSVNANEGVLNKIYSCDFANSDKNAIDKCFFETIELIMEENRRIGRSVKSAAVMNMFIPEPIDIGDFPFNLQQTESLKIDADMTGVNLFGLSDFKLEATRADYKNKFITIVFSATPIQMEGTYYMKGNVLLLPLEGGGDFWATGKNVTLTFDARLIRNKGNSKFMALENPSADIVIGAMDLRFLGLFENDDILDETMHHFLNSNDRFVLDVITPILNQKLAVALYNIMNDVFANIPMNAVYP